MQPPQQPRAPAGNSADGQLPEAALRAAIQDLISDVLDAYESKKSPEEIRALLVRLEELHQRRLNHIAVEFEVDFRLKSAVAAILKGRFLYVGPDVSNKRIMTITLSFVTILVVLFGGLFLLLQKGLGAN